MPEWFERIKILPMNINAAPGDNLPIALLTAVIIDYRLGSEERMRQEKFLFEPDEKPVARWLSDVDRDFNVAFRRILRHPGLADGTVHIYWDDGVRPSLPIPLKDARQDLRTVGDLVKMISSIMASSGQFSDQTQENNIMFEIARRLIS